MSEGIVFDYYYGMEADQFSFIKIPKLLLFDPKFSALSLGAVMLYGLLLDRMGLSSRRGWRDEEGKVYIRYKIKNIEDDLNLSEKTATKYLSELENIGLVEKLKVGLGQGNILYVKNFISQDLKNKAFITGKIYGNEEEKNIEIKSKSIGNNGEKAETTLRKASKINIPVDFAGYGAVDLGGNEAVKNGGNGAVNFAGYSDKDINNNKYNNNPYPNHIISGKEDRYYEHYLNRILDDKDDEIGLMDCTDRESVFREGIRKQLSYDFFKNYRHDDLKIVDELIEQMVEIMLDHSPIARISGKEFEANYVKNRILKLNREHIEYILVCLKNNRKKIGSIKNYLRTTIFNASTTVHSYDQAEENYDARLFGLL